MTYEPLDDPIWIERAGRSLAASWAAIVAALGGRTARHDDLWLVDADSPNSMLNNATLVRPMRAGDAEPLTRRLDAFFSHHEPGRNWSLWSAWPTPDMTDLGYRSWGHDTIMVRLPGGAAPPMPPELQIVGILDPAELARVEREFVVAFPVWHVESLLPGAFFHPALLGGPFRIWGGYVDGEIVSIAAALIEDDMIDVSFIATVPHARRRGYGAAITWHATTAEPALPAVLEATAMGRPVYERLGYQAIGQTTMWERRRW